MEQNGKWLQYAILLQSQIADIFNPDSENYINPDDFEDENNGTAFFHALANVMPCHMFNKLTGEDVDMLGFNHNANRLIMQFCNTNSDTEQE